MALELLFNQWVDILNYAAIYSGEETVREFDPSRLDTTTQDFMFAFGVIGIDLNANETSYFDLAFEVVWRDENGTKHKDFPTLSACTVDQWSHFGDGFE